MSNDTSHRGFWFIIALKNHVWHIRKKITYHYSYKINKIFYNVQIDIEDKNI